MSTSLLERIQSLLGEQNAQQTDATQRIVRAGARRILNHVEGGDLRRVQAEARSLVSVLRERGPDENRESIRLAREIVAVCNSHANAELVESRVSELAGELLIARARAVRRS